MDDPNMPPTAPVRKAPRWIKIVLAISLALNLLVIGAAIGVATRIKPYADAAAGPRGGIAFVTALEREDRRAVLRQTRDTGRDARRSSRQDMQQMLALLRADTFDPQAFEAALQNQKTRTQQMQATIGAAVLARVSEMSVAERNAYADRIEAHITRGKKKRAPKQSSNDDS